MCACGQNSNIQTMTTTEVNALLEAARQQVQTEAEAMVASAQSAIGNANSGASALR